MNHEALGKLMDRWTNDTEFRQAVRRDPQAAINAAGMTLSDEELAAIAAIDWSLSDAELTDQAKFAI